MACRKKRRRLGQIEPRASVAALRKCQSKFKNAPSKLSGCEAGVDFLLEEVGKEKRH